MLELPLPLQFKVTVTMPDYQYAEQKFYAGSISRTSLTSVAKTATMTIDVSPLIFSYYITLNEFFEKVRNHAKFKVDRAKLMAKNKTIPYLLKDDRLFYFKEPLRFDESKIGHTNVIPSLILTLEESYELVPVAPIVIPSARSVSSAKKIMQTKYIR